MSIYYNQSVFYYYVTNLQGDVVGIIDKDGTVLVSYTYDAWGNLLSISGSKASTLGQQNPLRYRGYVFDPETNLYYLQSRYYDPEVGRFINADTYTSTGKGFIGNNMFAYCNNNPVNNSDPNGEYPDSFGGIAGQNIGRVIYELITGDEHPGQKADELDAQRRVKRIQRLKKSMNASWKAYEHSIELEAQAQYNHDMQVKEQCNDVFSSPTRFLDFAAMAFTNSTAYGSYVGLASAASVTVGGVALVVATLAFAAWSTLRYYDVIPEKSWEEIFE